MYNFKSIQNAKTKNRYIKFLVLFFLSFIITNTEAQVALTSCGGEASGAGGFSSYSFGQVLYLDNDGTTGSENQGIQQPFEFWVVYGIGDPLVANLFCKVYPNPVESILTLKIEKTDLDGLFFSLYDISGKRILKEIILREETEIDLINFSESVFLLKITRNNNEIGAFKIIKN
jgi:hypothetical protein